MLRRVSTGGVLVLGCRGAVGTPAAALGGGSPLLWRAAAVAPPHWPLCMGGSARVEPRRVFSSSSPSLGCFSRTSPRLRPPNERQTTAGFFDKEGSSLKERQQHIHKDDSSLDNDAPPADAASAAPAAGSGEPLAEEPQGGTMAPPSPKDAQTITRAMAGERVPEVGAAPSQSSAPAPSGADTTTPRPPPPKKKKKVDGGMVRKDGIKISEDPSQIPIRVVVAKVLALLWPRGETKVKVLVASSVACVLIAKVLKVAVPFWFKSIVDLLAPATTAASLSATVGPITVGIFGCVVAYGIARTTVSLAEELKTVLFAPVGSHASTKLAMEMFTKLHNLDLNFHLNRETGVLSKDLDRGSRAFWSLAYALLFMVVPTMFEMVLVCAALNTQAGPQFISIAVVAVVSYIAWTYVITNWRAKFRTRYNALDSRVGGLIVDSLLNYETVKYFGSEKYEHARIGTETAQMNRELMRLDQTMAVLNLGQQLIFVTAGVLSLYLATCGVLAGAMTVGDLVLIDALLMQLYMPLSYLGMIYREVQASTQNMQAMIALLSHENEVQEAANAKPYEHVDGTIELKNVYFEYKKDDGRMVLRDLSLVIPGGKTVAFVGPSGSGKSTIFRLLFRFYDPTAGGIYFDGQPLSALQLPSLREKVGVVPQDTVLFNESVSYNIRYGRMDATEEEVVEAAKKASLHETVLNMIDGYDTPVGERGLKLSGGEKQRVAIARVVLQDPPILLADEATSALDSTTESNVMQTLKTATGRDRPRTIILIAHRLTTVKGADIIFVLDGKGGLAEQGGHHELLARGGLYSEMWHRQLRDSRRAAGSESSKSREGDGDEDDEGGEEEHPTGRAERQSAGVAAK